MRQVRNVLGGDSLSMNPRYVSDEKTLTSNEETTRVVKSIPSVKSVT
jgi:hypothetical protein